jgi:RNA polymerase sigma-70 factor, ECF subfamily
MDMETATLPSGIVGATSSDEEVVHRVAAGETALFEVLMRRHNQRLYRVARSVVLDEAEAEDVVQQAYINAFRHLGQFEARARFTTWMTQIALNEAYARRRKSASRAAVVNQVGGGGDARGGRDDMEARQSPAADPERLAYTGELRRLIEDAVDGLPDGYRSVFMLRDVEGLSTEETGTAMGLSDDAVKTRLHRARAMVRQTLTSRLGAAASQAFAFPATRCDRVVAFVLARIGGESA